jgi:hypothetical protein
VDRNNPVGLMLLSEVALGDMYELKKATVSFNYLGERKPNCSYWFLSWHFIYHAWFLQDPDEMNLP